MVCLKSLDVILNIPDTTNHTSVLSRDNLKIEQIKFKQKELYCPKKAYVCFADLECDVTERHTPIIAGYATPDLDVRQLVGQDCVDDMLSSIVEDSDGYSDVEVWFHNLAYDFNCMTTGLTKIISIYKKDNTLCGVRLLHRGMCHCCTER